MRTVLQQMILRVSELDALTSHSDGCGHRTLIKSAAKAEEEVLVPTSRTIIMDTLWVLLVKCKLRKSLKK